MERVKAKAEALAYLEAKAKANTGVLHYVQDDGRVGRGWGTRAVQVDWGER
jgi:hypothetical protein